MKTIETNNLIELLKETGKTNEELVKLFDLYIELDEDGELVAKKELDDNARELKIINKMNKVNALEKLKRIIDVMEKAMKIKTDKAVDEIIEKVAVKSIEKSKKQKTEKAVKVVKTEKAVKKSNGVPKAVMNSSLPFELFEKILNGNNVEFEINGNMIKIDNCAATKFHKTEDNRIGFYHPFRKSYIKTEKGLMKIVNDIVSAR